MPRPLLFSQDEFAPEARLRWEAQRELAAAAGTPVVEVADPGAADAEEPADVDMDVAAGASGDETPPAEGEAAAEGGSAGEAEDDDAPKPTS